MLLDNLFPMLGGLGTAVILLAILAFVSTAALGAVCPASVLRRLQPRGR
ncbi:MAG: hypothetical protein K0S65_2491 [Labilithrix sp.]|nr:hypothetical protein [Labilithrix sp.]